MQIRRTFKDVPLLWTLLELTAWYRPSLTTCSVLLRAIAATVIANWNLSEGILLTNVMALGQILPPPLASIRDILPILDSHQVFTTRIQFIFIINSIQIEKIYAQDTFLSNSFHASSLLYEFIYIKIHMHYNK